ncbi:MAG: protoporphyrinogen oxidase [Chlorobi bacterium]|nr:protoporphyrinogen oxidase [Chlorobiota bacterium]
MTSNETTQYDTIIIGGGVSGLVTAVRLKYAGQSVLVIEKKDQAGGAISTSHAEGFLFEGGPNSALDSNPLISELFQSLDIQGERCNAAPESSNRYILKHGELIPLPMSPPAFFATRLFPLRAKLRLFREPFIKPSPPDADETVADFVLRRLGRDFLDYAIDPFIAGIFAGKPDQLSVRAAFPKLFELEQKYGSLIKGQIKGKKERKKRLEKSKQTAGMFSFFNGMETLPRAMHRYLGNAVLLSTTVEAFSRSDGLFRVDLGERTVTAPRLVISAPADATAKFIKELAPDLGREFTAIPYPPVAIVGMGFKREDVKHPLDGFGFLVPQVEGREILGTIFSSTLFPFRAPEGRVLLTTFVGGMRQPENALLPESKLFELVLKEIRDLLGVRGAPVFQASRAWKRAIPQYVPGHLDIMQRVQELEERIPGLFFCANYRGGISVGDCIKSAYALADRIAARASQEEPEPKQA